MVVPAGELLTAPVVVGVPEYGPWLVTPVTWLLMIGGTGLVAPGISEIGMPAYEAAEEAAALLVTGFWLYEYGNGVYCPEPVPELDAPVPSTWTWPSLIWLIAGAADAATRRPAAIPALRNILKFGLGAVYSRKRWETEDLIGTHCCSSLST